MILVFGGTTEGKQVITMLDQQQLPYIYSTKTNIAFTGTFGTYRFGALLLPELIDFCNNNNVNIIINAAHPFAENLHQNISQASKQLEILVYRLERVYTKTTLYTKAIYLSNYNLAIAYLKEQNISSLLALTGVQTIEKLADYWKSNLTYFRILPREHSKKIAEKALFPPDQLILSYPNASLEAEILFYKKINCQAVITKESGDSGFLSLKIQAAKQCDIPIIIIQKKQLPANFITITSPIQLIPYLY